MIWYYYCRQLNTRGNIIRPLSTPMVMGDNIHYPLCIIMS